MPEDLRRNLATYEAERAIVFEGLDFFLVWTALMVRGYDWLARHHVHLGPERPSQEAIVSLLRERTLVIG